MKKLLKGAVLIGAILMLSGCLLNVKSDNHSSDSKWHDNDLDIFSIGKTSMADVEDQLGRPDRNTRSRNGAQLWEYRNRDERNTEVGFFLLFHFESNHEEIDSLFVEFEDDLVVRYWTERDYD